MSKNRSIFSSRVVKKERSSDKDFVSKEIPYIFKEYLKAKHPETRNILSNILKNESVASDEYSLSKVGRVNITVRYEMSPKKSIWVNKYYFILDIVFQGIIDTIKRWNLSEDIYPILKQNFIDSFEPSVNISAEALSHVKRYFKLGKKKLEELEQMTKEEMTEEEYTLEIEKDDTEIYDTEVYEKENIFFLKNPLLNKKIEIIKISLL